MILRLRLTQYGFDAKTLVMSETRLKQAAQLIQQADALLITAGAGMGIDSGLPDFRGVEGFWKAYPGLRSHGLSFTDMANPQAFVEHPRLAWGFYGHRLKLYRETHPHVGFQILYDWARQKPGGSFVFTSNVDGQFQKAGFKETQITECHGSIHHLQCINDCGIGIWPVDLFQPEVDLNQCLLLSDLPRCPGCDSLARPNILMFGDWGWDDTRSQQQTKRQERWLRAGFNSVVIELGAGTAVPSVRYFGESLRLPIIRINPDEFQLHTPGIGLAMGAYSALHEIDNLLT